MSVMDRTNVASDVPAGEWSVDASRSSVGFALKHMMLATVRGCFHEFDGTLEIGSGAPRATGVVKAASIDTNEPVRDKHLRESSDFFDIESYPEIGFSSTQVVDLDGGGFRILGDLTMRDVTQKIALDAQVNSARRGAGDDERIELDLHGEINRRDFGLIWNQREKGGVLLGNKVAIALEISAVKSDATQSE
jgi:polyisoprenoid-binding protein YceI